MRMLPVLLFTIISINAFSQNAPKEDTTVKIFHVTSIPRFIDSLRNKILSDTVKFNPRDVISTSKGNRNIHSYSALFFINMRYQYKLDIVRGNDVVAFINEMLVPDKIESISLLIDSISVRRFGENGKNGVIILILKENSNSNFKVAGLKIGANKYNGNNFYQQAPSQ